ncbi:alpha/beta hydrolase [Hamadaea tsunoensis]|uniref:alpha/beta hydrolase n=1 Tax=Hamadaea tsunoensis TaxID=53368 RepID=UPI000405BABC|nr:alpha/beta fold hydrolase [Hamadaea tsunoensis]
MSHEAYAFDGSSGVGVLVCHGFTGSPVSMRPWAEHLAAQNWSVRLPLLPGHGTHWTDANRTTWEHWFSAVTAAFASLRETCSQVFVVGLSMGGTLALRLAEENGPAISGVVVVNPSVLLPPRDNLLLPVIGRVLSNLPAIGNDIKKPDVTEGAYDRTPLKAALSLRSFQRLVREDLGKVTQPLLLLRSAEDHVVPAASSAFVLSHVGSAAKREIVLADSYHVATLDNDAELIFSESTDFINSLVG